jgi:chromosome transmission fidelity protein 18
MQGMPAKGQLLPTAVRQMVGHEADMEAIRRTEAARRGGGGVSSPPAAHHAGDAAALADGTNRSQPLPPPKPSLVPLTLAERMAAANVGRHPAAAANAAAAPRKQGNWLDALREKRTARPVAAGHGEGPGAHASRDKFPVLYRFHEGVTNAVKRPVLMSDLLG